MSLKELWVWEMATVMEGGLRVQELSEGKEDAELCSESCQDSDVDGSEFPGCKGTVEDLVEFLRHASECKGASMFMC